MRREAPAELFPIHHAPRDRFANEFRHDHGGGDRQAARARLNHTDGSVEGLFGNELEKAGIDSQPRQQRDDGRHHDHTQQSSLHMCEDVSAEADDETANA